MDNQPAGKGYTILFWKRSYLESITVQAPQPPSPQPSLVPLSPTGWSRVKEHEITEESLLGLWEVCVQSHPLPHASSGPSTQGSSRSTQPPPPEKAALNPGRQRWDHPYCTEEERYQGPIRQHSSIPWDWSPTALQSWRFFSTSGSSWYGLLGSQPCGLTGQVKQTLQRLSMWGSPHITPAEYAMKPLRTERDVDLF